MDYKLKHSIKKMIIFILSFIVVVNISDVYTKIVRGENSTQIIEEEIFNEDIPYENLIQKTNEEGYISVYTAEDLKNIKNDLSGNYSLENDIDLDGEEWIPIGTSENPFTGVFDGNNRTISNLKIESGTNNIGFFGFTNTAEIRNLVIENSTVSGKEYIGALVGQAKYSKISNVHIKESTITGDVCVGGLAGYTETTEIKQCSVTGEGLVTGNYSTGGVIGFMINASKLNESFSTIDIKGNVKSIGGLVGILGVSGEIRNCYSSSAVHGDSNYTAGILGLGYGGEATKIENTLFTGIVSSNSGIWSNFHSGGVVVKNSYFNLDTVISTVPADQAKNFDELNQKETFIGWDFENIWVMNGEYPELRMQSKPTDPEPPNEKPKGSGTESDPYIIVKVEDFTYINEELNAHYKLGNNIDLAGINFKPIGTSENPFTGVFDGNNRTISNLKIESGTNNIGFFGFTNTAEIRNLVIENSTVSGKEYVGALVGQAKYSKISNVHIKESTITGDVCVGGLAGYTETTEIKQCSVTGEGLVTGNYSTGGVIGFMINASKLNESFSTIDIKGNVKSIGGLVGVLGVSGEIRNCYSSSAVHGDSNYTAGILGLGYGGEATKIENTLFTGIVSSNSGIWSNFHSGGVVVKNSYFNLDTVISTVPADQAKNFDELTQKETFIGWDFENIWVMNGGYPELRM